MSDYEPGANERHWTRLCAEAEAHGWNLGFCYPPRPARPHFTLCPLDARHPDNVVNATSVEDARRIWKDNDRAAVRQLGFFEEGHDDLACVGGHGHAPRASP